VKVQIPTKLNAEQRALFEQLAASFGRKERAVATTENKDNHQTKDGERHGKGFFERVKETFIGPDDE
jgi:DnaJ-class molecular chaperone